MSDIALVTGASAGLGREFVRQIDHGRAGQISEIWAVARRSDRLEALVRATDTPVRPFCLDLTDPLSFGIIQSSLEEMEDARVSLIVNNAGFGVFGSFDQQGENDATQMIQLLVRAPVELTYRVLPFMSRGSRIINISSVAAFLPQPELAVYAASKRFVLDVTRALDAELGAVGIHATAVCPKFMETEFLDEPGNRAAARRMTAIGYERVETVARAALRSSRAGRGLCIPALDMKALYAISRVVPYQVAIAAERVLGIL